MLTIRRERHRSCRNYTAVTAGALPREDGADTVVTVQGAYGSIRVLNATPDEVVSGIDFFYV